MSQLKKTIVVLVLVLVILLLSTLFWTFVYGRAEIWVSFIVFLGTWLSNAGLGTFLGLRKARISPACVLGIALVNCLMALLVAIWWDYELLIADILSFEYFLFRALMPLCLVLLSGGWTVAILVWMILRRLRIKNHDV